MIMLSLALAAAAAQASPPTFSADVESVYVDVFVRDERGAVTRLAATDFELRDNGVPQRVELVSLETAPLTTLLLLDTSASVTGAKLEQLEAAVRAFLRGMRPGDEAALLTFGREITVRLRPTADLASVERALEDARPGSETAVYDAVYAATLLAPERSRSMVVLFTDGEDNLSVLELADVLGLLERSDVMVHAVGVVSPSRGGVTYRPYSIGGGGNNDAYGPSGRYGTYNPASGASASSGQPATVAVASGDTETGHVRTLRRMAEATGGRFWTASGNQELTSAFAAIGDAMRTRYLLKYEPAGVARDGRHALDIRLKRGKAIVHSRKAYFVAPAAH